MHLILSSKAAKKLKIEPNSIQDFTPDIDAWRIDCLALTKRSIFVITNEKTLYTCISSYKQGFSGIAQKIAVVAKQDSFDIDDIRYVKFQHRSVIGSMNDIKRLISHFDKYNPENNEFYEKLINQTTFKYLSSRSPAEVHLSSTSSHPEN